MDWPAARGRSDVRVDLPRGAATSYLPERRARPDPARAAGPITVKRLLQLFRWRSAHVLPALLLVVLLALVLTGCETNTPQNTFDAHGEVARKQRDLFYLAMWPAIAVMVLVMGVLVVALLRFRRRSADQLPKQVHGNTRLEVMWTILPAVLLLGYWFLIQFFAGYQMLAIQTATAGGVAWWAHVGGFLVGLLLAISLEPKRRGPVIEVLH